MTTARFHLDKDLVELLTSPRRAADFDYVFTGPQSVKHLIESLGIPHTEIGALQANGQPVDLRYLVKDGDDIIARAASPTGPSTEEPRFVIDGHLGRLSARLRMLGLDCLYRNEYGDEKLADMAIAERRFLLTRDRHLLMRKTISRGHLVRHLDPKQQLKEVVQHFALEKWIRPFQRCIRCNHLLEPVEKQAVLDRLEPLTRLYFDEFHICPACSRIYWKGSHFEKMQRLIAELT